MHDCPDDRDRIHRLLSESDLGQFDLDYIQSQALKSVVKLRSTYDVCLIDSGGEMGVLFAQLRMLGVKAPIVTLTSDSAFDVLDAWHHGAADCLIKDKLTAHCLEESICVVIAFARKKKDRSLCQRYYLGLIEHTRDLIFVHDLDGNFTSINGVGEELFGYGREEILKMNLAEILAPECMGGWQRSIKRLLERRKTESQQLEVVTKTGERLSLMVSSHLIFKNGTPIGVQSVGHITSGMLPFDNVGPSDPRPLPERVRFEL